MWRERGRGACIGDAHSEKKFGLNHAGGGCLGGAE